VLALVDLDTAAICSRLESPSVAYASFGLSALVPVGRWT
jgi:hypothetical protein